jgi:uncharacterized damage-inducible protein DinB
MSMAQSLLPEFDHEMRTTRALVERIPEARADWRPHPKSMTLGQLAAHLTAMIKWGSATIRLTELDIDSPAAAAYAPPRFETTAALVETFDANVRGTRDAIAGASDADLSVDWALIAGGRTVFSMPRVASLRTFVMNHHIHHRGQLSLYLRLLDVPLPSIYGPTADELR